MQQQLLTVQTNKPLTAAVYRMVLTGDMSAIHAPGQFVNLRLNGLFLRRPISVCDWSADTLTLLYKVVGTGTAAMAATKPGEQLDVLVGLGNGYNTAESGPAPLLIGGGVGVPPLYALAKQLLAEDKTPTVILGFNTAAEVFYQKEFSALGIPVLLATADGSAGVKGFVTDVMEPLTYSFFYTCGPEAMLRAVDKAARAGIGGQFSFEERMGCGFGACMGCSCKTKYGNKRICRDGPVLEREEIVW